MHSPSHGLWLIDAGTGGVEEVPVGRVSSRHVARRLDAMLEDIVAPAAR